MSERRIAPIVKRGAWPAVIYIGLLVIGIPWYWPSDNHLVIFGVPAWVVVAIGVSFAASMFTAYLLWSPWPGENGDFRERPKSRERNAG